MYIILALKTFLTSYHNLFNHTLLENLYINFWVIPPTDIENNNAQIKTFMIHWYLWILSWKKTKDTVKPLICL